MQDAVVVKDLVKRYPRATRPAVDGLSFSIRAGEVFGLLGPNGAGKTTTVSVLTTRTLPTAGYAGIAGVDVVRQSALARRMLAVVPQRQNLDQSLTIRQNLIFHAAYHGMGRSERRRRAAELIDWMGLTARADARADQVSGGQAQRVMIARALMHRPTVMFLDEPATGLDPQSRLFVHERIAELRKDGVTVVVTTHDMDEAAKLCDRVGIVDHGRLLALDETDKLTQSLPGSTTLTVSLRLYGAVTSDVGAALGRQPEVTRVEELTRRPDDDPSAVSFRLYSERSHGELLSDTLRIVSGLQCTVTDVAFSRPSLEDVFISLTGRDLR
ncbi:ATP-binding cassette domain-containing protein [Rugosimonospora acidiphila]|uniref:ATP-binding cassette domain-containing protein n=1 Tax=Rugosimonospora acidiphila TaxID=556531 RepID=A0ABP9STB4_9ACTN